MPLPRSSDDCFEFSVFRAPTQDCLRLPSISNQTRRITRPGRLKADFDFAVCYLLDPGKKERWR